MSRVLITGGAGFIGSHVADALVARGDRVTLLDVLHPQVHGQLQKAPSYLNPGAELVIGDVRDDALVGRLVADVDVVVHLAAHTGVGQSMYRVRDYLDVNAVGTAVLLEQVALHRRAIKIVVASSRAVYGEGAYVCDSCGPVSPGGRVPADLDSGEWDVSCPRCGNAVCPVPTAEGEPTRPGSVYGLSKLDQERLTLLLGATYSLPVVALRFFNVYGPRQSLRNPYTGVVATFVTRCLNGRPPEVYEDGRESRDFVHVADVVQATLSAIDFGAADGQVFNVGHGTSLTLHQVASLVADALGAPEPVVTGRYRHGDIRHCLADVGRAREVLRYEPVIDPAQGIASLASGLAGQHFDDLSRVADAELAAHGLLPSHRR
jgi:dTDP-L-rhamnose 4-epimerase